MFDKLNNKVKERVMLNLRGKKNVNHKNLKRKRHPVQSVLIRVNIYLYSHMGAS